MSQWGLLALRRDFGMFLPLPSPCLTPLGMLSSAALQWAAPEEGEGRKKGRGWKLGV